MAAKQKNKVSVELGGENSDFVRIHTTVQISETSFQSFNWPLKESYGEYLERVGSPGSEIIHEVIGVDGLISVSIERFMVHVTYGKLFNQQEVAENVLKIVENFLRPDEVIGASWRIEPSL